MEGVYSALPQPVRAFVKDSILSGQCIEDSHFGFPFLSFAPVTGRKEKERCSFATPSLDKFQGTGENSIYQLLLRLLNMRLMEGVRESRWSEFFGPDSS